LQSVMDSCCAQFPSRFCATLSIGSIHTGNFVMTDFGKLLIVLGGILLVAGVVIVLLGRTNLPIGRLPGDIVYRGKNTTFYFPLATSIVLSVLLTLILYVIGRWRR
jgi:hypothetical protein